MTRIEILSGPIPPIESDNSHTSEGSEIIFHGRVRDFENNQYITGIEYEYYPGMAEKILHVFANEALDRFDINSLICQHRVGMVPVGEKSVRIIIWSKHRIQGFQAMDWFIMQLKQHVPIWKWGVMANGQKFPARSLPESVDRIAFNRDSQ